MSALRILHLEDNAPDAELLRAVLERQGVDCAIRRVETREAFEAALEREQFDLIISDYTLPSFDGLSALRIAGQKRPELPFVFVSGTIGEEAAVESLRRGATDYVLKDRLSRLAASVKRAVEQAQARAERRQGEEKIREQAALLDKARDAICVTDMERRILYWNKGAERLYGWSAEEAVGQNVNDLLVPGGSTRPAEALQELIPRDEWQGELHKVRKDAREIIVESHWTLLRDEAGQPKSILVIDTDITEKKRIEAELLRTQRMESIGALAGGIAHDLNNVLAPILIVTELLRDKLADPEVREMLDLAKASAQRGAEMVKQILSFARGASGELKILQVKHLLHEMVKLVRDTFPRSIQIENDVVGDLYPINGDATQLHQVLLNLCLNARDAMPNGGTLLIEAANVVLENKQTAMLAEPVSGKHVVLSVADTGSGIPPELLDKIYEPFFTTKEPGKGTGLGLSTVLSIVQTHHGFIELISEVGRGTVFSVYLPAARTEDTGFVGIGLATVEMGRGETVLLVEDEAALLEITREMLEAFNYRVLTARDGAEALALYEQHGREIDVVVTDMVMPVMDGAALVQELRRIQPQVKVVCVSGLGSKAKAAQLNPHAFLAKPYSTDKLLTTLREVIAAR
ncbi:MAG: hybrid sensor histidine kinase/response regulator [Verrucomicrobia bacterium]|nr:MAG: hybrid sensor histidine kinase/response regulator [Verrucomicrobiota bacterium]